MPTGLIAFVAVAAAVVVLRRIAPDAPRTFRVPLYPVVPVLCALSCLYLAYLLPGITWTLFAVWLLLAAGLYLCFGRRHSRLRGNEAAPDGEAPVTDGVAASSAGESDPRAPRV
ncbi:amino acid permease C-terminal domain-containing protein [Streptomyces pathocidini]|uniref:Amino acid permease C-terminal domain-containing protein n=1 Tax=Streptomyces pathocidini TaxID=1650571 RepID=A0ABW7UPG7_9ACTN|nr:amino acid permease C-terminal domain-containing protein [Streptomyces pathocidini]